MESTPSLVSIATMESADLAKNMIDYMSYDTFALQLIAERAIPYRELIHDMSESKRFCGDLGHDTSDSEITKYWSLKVRK